MRMLLPKPRERDSLAAGLMNAPTGWPGYEQRRANIMSTSSTYKAQSAGTHFEQTPAHKLA